VPGETWLSPLWKQWSIDLASVGASLKAVKIRMSSRSTPGHAQRVRFAIWPEIGSSPVQQEAWFMGTHDSKATTAPSEVLSMGCNRYYCGSTR
jgi:hypothetical protein